RRPHSPGSSKHIQGIRRLSTHLKTLDRPRFRCDWTILRARQRKQSASTRQDLLSRSRLLSGLRSAERRSALSTAKADSVVHPGQYRHESSFLHAPSTGTPPVRQRGQVHCSTLSFPGWRLPHPPYHIRCARRSNRRVGRYSSPVLNEMLILASTMEFDSAES